LYNVNNIDHTGAALWTFLRCRNALIQTNKNYDVLTLAYGLSSGWLL